MYAVEIKIMKIEKFAISKYYLLVCTEKVSGRYWRAGESRVCTFYLVGTKFLDGSRNDWKKGASSTYEQTFVVDAASLKENTSRLDVKKTEYENTFWSGLG